MCIRDRNKIASLHEVTLRMEHVKIRYGSRTILKDLDWEIKNGEKWALFGPNGAGKSTLQMCIRDSSSFGNNQPLIVVDGVPIANDNAKGATVNLGSGLNDINPEDIESISVLKGGSAAVSYTHLDVYKRQR